MVKFRREMYLLGRLLFRCVKQFQQVSIAPQTRLVSYPKIRFMSQTAYSSSENENHSLPEPLFSLDSSTEAALKQYSALNPRPLSMSKFLTAGQTVTARDQFVFLRTEMPIRLANMIMELHHLQDQLTGHHQFQEILQQYLQSFRDMLEFKGVEGNAGNREKFLESLVKIRARHADTVPAMAAAVQSVKGANIDQDYINYFQDRFYLSRISIHMLISYYRALHENTQSQARLVGIIDPHCDVVQTAKNAFEDAAYICDREYIEHTELTVITRGEAVIPYVPAHLHHIFFEIFKNAMRATCETAHREKLDELDNVVCEIVRSEDELTIKISDRGGGIDRETSQKLFDYHFTTAGGVGKERNVLVPGAGGLESAAHPMHGLGYGLPLSRLYARYFQGNIELSSMHGYGTDVFIYLRALSRDATEHLPVYGPTSVGHMKRRASTKIADWTS